MKTQLTIILFTGIFIILTLSCNSTSKQSNYKGKPFSNERYQQGPQKIPGKVQCEYYDFGGEGVAYHDTDSINSGSGGLNPADGTYLHEFRINEAVDISYTKMDTNRIDNNPYNFVEPIPNQLYVGWTNSGEWTKYTINVKTTGKYKVGIMYTSNKGGQISLDINDKNISGLIDIPSTYVAEDSLDWRQWHHWNFMDDIAEFDLQKGVQILTLHTVSNGQMNYDYLIFSLKND